MWIFTCFVFLVMRKHANPWPIHALDAKKYLQKATFLKICEKTHTGCSLKIVFFPLNFVIFLNSASSAAALVFYLPGVCTHTATEGKQSPEYFSKFGKKHNI